MSWAKIVTVASDLVADNRERGPPFWGSQE